MLDAETRMLLDLMEAATKAGRPKLETLPHAIGRKSVDKMSEDSEADPPEVAETIDGAFAGPGGEIGQRDARIRSESDVNEAVEPALRADVEFLR